jgi:ABC-type thiamin/hydroxymethylpyrimidine transport system permease subunit
MEIAPVTTSIISSVPSKEFVNASSRGIWFMSATICAYEKIK